MYFLSKKEFKKDRLKVLVLGLVIGISIGICGGFIWASAAMMNAVRITVTQLPQQMHAIPF